MLDQKINSVINWLLYSGIQNPEGSYDLNDNDVSGCFNAWFDLEKNNYSYIYTEISGYALTLLLYLYKETGDNIYLQRAQKVGDWLLKIQHHTGAFPTAFYLSDNSSQKPNGFHSFDAVMVFNGLTNLYRHINQEKYLISAKKAADWVLDYQKKDGSIATIVDEDKNKVEDNQETWSSQPGSYHAKLAIGYLNLYDLTKKENYLKAARKLCDYALSFQQSDGQFFTYGKIKGTNFHPHAYTAEGLFIAGTYLNEVKYKKSAQKAIQWAISFNKEGIIPRQKYKNTLNYNERIDILAQIYRLAILLGIKNHSNEKILKHILNHQYFGENKSQHGGFLFGKLSSGEKVPHINCWVSMFALQAMKLHQGQILRPFDLV